MRYHHLGDKRDVRYRPGTVINLGGMAGQIGLAGGVTWSGTKGALLARAAEAEEIRHGIAFSPPRPHHRSSHLRRRRRHRRRIPHHICIYMYWS